MLKKELASALDYVLSRGFQIHPDAFELLGSLDSGHLKEVVREVVKKKTKQSVFEISQGDLEACLGIDAVADMQVEYKVISEPTSKITSGEGIDGYGALFASRFKKLRQIISNRPESKMLKTITSAKNAKTDEDIYVCGLVVSKDVSRDVAKLSLEDPTGSLEGLIFDDEVQKKAGMLLDDQFVMAKMAIGKNSGFVVKELILPDIPERQSNRSEGEVFAVFLSDLHIGSRYFMEKEFEGFVSWLTSPNPVARKIRFVLISGDVIDGVGIYPNQDKELVCQTVEEQLEKARKLLAGVPKEVKIFIMPGNHDPGRRALPQPAIPSKYNQALWKMENVIMVGNPAVVSLNGVNVLMFHGQSIDDIVKTTPGLSYDVPVNVMRHLLRARHLSPIYGSQTPIAPEIEDMMVMDDVPDIFHVGHVHRAQVDMYKGILLINSGSWQRQTPFQASVGMVPNPGIAVVVNLKTFKVLYENYNTELDNVLEA